MSKLYADHFQYSIIHCHKLKLVTATVIQGFFNAVNASLYVVLNLYTASCIPRRKEKMAAIGFQPA